MTVTISVTRDVENVSRPTRDSTDSDGLTPRRVTQYGINAETLFTLHLSAASCKVTIYLRSSVAKVLPLR